MANDIDNSDGFISLDEGNQAAEESNELSIRLTVEIDDDYVANPTVGHLRKLEKEGAVILFIHRKHETLFGPRRFMISEDGSTMKCVGIDEDPYTAQSSGDYKVDHILENYYVTNDCRGIYDDFLKEVTFHTMGIS